MKFTCDVTDLKNGAQACDRALATGSAENRNIKITVTDGKISLCGYNGAIGVTTSVSSVGECENGVIVLPSKMFAGIIGKLEKAKLVTVSDDVRVATIKCGEAVFKIGTIPLDTYPEMKAGEIIAMADMPQQALKDMLEETLYAVNEKLMYKQICTGEQLAISPGTLKVTGLDSYRIATASCKIKYSGKPFDFVVPKKALSFIAGIIDYSDDPIHVAIDSRHAIFNVEGYEIYTSLLSGIYPDVNKIINTKVNTTCTLDALAFAKSIQRVSVVSRDTGVPLVCEFDPDKTLSVSCTTALGSASDVLKLDNYSGGKVRIGVNPMYIFEAVHHSPDSKISISLGSPISPMVIAPECGDSFRFVILPVRLREEKSE